MAILATRAMATASAAGAYGAFRRYAATALEYVGASSADLSSNWTVPSGAQAGDILVIKTWGVSIAPIPSGFTDLGSGVPATGGYFIGYRRMLAGDTGGTIGGTTGRWTVLAFRPNGEYAGVSGVNVGGAANWQVQTFTISASGRAVPCIVFASSSSNNGAINGNVTTGISMNVVNNAGTPYQQSRYLTYATGESPVNISYTLNDVGSWQVSMSIVVWLTF